VTLMAESHIHSLDEARTAKPRALALFESLAEVVGVGITKIGDGYGLKVNLREAPSTDILMPTDVDGVPVQLEVVGQPRAH
jgi:hypothetical protein